MMDPTNNNNNQIIPSQSTPTLLGIPRELQRHIGFFLPSRSDLRHLAASSKLSRKIQLKALIESERESRAGYGPLSEKLSLKGFSEDENGLNQLYTLLRGNHEIHTWCRSRDPSSFSYEERTDFYTFSEDPESKKYILYQTHDDQTTDLLPKFLIESHAGWSLRFHVYRRNEARIQILPADVVKQKLHHRIEQLLEYLQTDEERIGIRLETEGPALANSFKDYNPLLLQDLAYCYFLLVDFYYDSDLKETIAQQYSLFSAIYALAAGRASENTLMASFILFYRIFNYFRKVTLIADSTAKYSYTFSSPFLLGNKGRYYTDEIKQAVVDCLAMGLNQEKALVTEALTSSTALIRSGFPSFTFLETLRGFFITAKQFGLNNAIKLLVLPGNLLRHPNNLAKWIEAGLEYDSVKCNWNNALETLLGKDCQAYLTLFKKLKINASEGIRFLGKFPRQSPNFLFLLPIKLIKAEIEKFRNNKPIAIKNWLVEFLNETEISLANWTPSNVRKLTYKVTIIKQVFLKYDEKTVMAIHDEIKKLDASFLTTLARQCNHYAWLLTTYPIVDLYSLFLLSYHGIKGGPDPYKALCSNKKIAKWFLTNNPSSEQLVEKVHQESLWVRELLNEELQKQQNGITLIDLIMRHYSVHDIKLLQNVRVNNDNTALDVLLHALVNSAFIPFYLEKIYSNNNNHQPRVSLLGILIRMHSPLSPELIEKTYKQTPDQNQTLFDEFYKNPGQKPLENTTATSTWKNGTSLFTAPNSSSSASMNNNNDTTHKRTMDVRPEEEEEVELKRKKLL